MENFEHWTSSLGGEKYRIEQEANELAGQLLVPHERLEEFYDQFAKNIKDTIPHFTQNPQLRTQFAETIASKFGVNTQVIEVRLERDGIWPAS